MRGQAGASEAKAAFERAVQAERGAIERHEAAARRQDEIADKLERQAAHETDQFLRNETRARAAIAHARAGAARERADRARQRLREEGLDPINEDGR